MSPAQLDLVRAARELLDRTDPATAGLWPRATALLGRQAIEGAMAELWKFRAAGVEKCSTRAQLLCLPLFLGDEKLAERVAYGWSALSHACHQHPYELAPTSPELLGLLQIAEDLVARVRTIVKEKAPNDKITS
jgi:hypothetical protein